MSATSKQATSADTMADGHAGTSPLLEQILAEMNSLSQKQTRVSPVRLKTFEEIERFAEIAKNSGMVPKDYVGKRDAIIVAVQLGSELGLAPMQSLQNIAVINGRPAIWGDALPGLCRASGMCKSIREWSEGEGDNQTFYCEAIRKDQSDPVVAHFSVADAKRAKLWQESPTVKRRSRDGGTYEADSGPWYSYPSRMLQMRARGFALRDAFPDVLKGLLSAEEARDIPWEDTGLSIVPPVATAVPLKPAAAATPRGERKIDPTPYEAPPEEPPRTRTRRDFLDGLTIALRDAQNAEEVDRIVCAEEVMRAKELFKNGHKEELDKLINTALIKWWTEPPTEGSGELPDVEIAGADKVLSG